MKQIILMCLCVASLFATDINIDGSYSRLLGNPFKAKLETKTKDISVMKTTDEVVKFEVDTNRKGDFGSSFTAPTFQVKASDCNAVLKTFLSEDYNIVSGSTKTASCKILPSKVTITYVMENEKYMNQISDIVVDLNILLDIDGQSIKLSNTMNKDLNKKNTLDYSLSIRAVWKLDNLSTEEQIHKMLEYSIYDILNKTLARN